MLRIRHFVIAALLMALTASAFAQGTVMPIPRTQWLNANGAVVSLGSLTIYEAGTTTLSQTYSCVGLTVGCLNPNPLPLNASGRPSVSGTEVAVFLTPGQSYKFVLKDSLSATLWTQDNVSAVPAGNVNVDIEAVAGEDITAGQVVYLSNGSGGGVAGQWYRGDADFTYANATPMVGIAPVAIASGTTGSVRIQGRVEDLSGLVPGTLYYISATPGALTSTPPADPRLMGQADGTTTFVVAPNPPSVSTAAIAAVVDPRIKTLSNGRLTLTTNVPVTTADVTAATSIFWTPYQGNEIALYSGTAWVTFAQAQLTIAVPATTDTNYDVFVDYNSGTPALALTAWTNATTRATALTTQDGVLVKTGATTQRYVGTFRTTGVSGQTEDSFAKRFVWNYYHRVPRQMRVVEATNSWNYSTASYQQANASAANQLAFVIGVAEVPLDAHVYALASTNNGTAYSVAVAIGIDSATTPTSGNVGMSAYVNNTENSPVSAHLTVYPAVGYHFAAWLEYSTGSTSTWYGDNNAPTIVQSGIYGSIDGL